ncbi:MAG TPA: hypothetical protein VIY51_02675 [Xanthobacteraceae bacterium]
MPILRPTVLAIIALLIAVTAAGASGSDFIARAKLPPPLARLHTCAQPSERVAVSIQPFAGATLFAIGCGRATAGFGRIALNPEHASALELGMRFAYYLARNVRGDGATRLRFPIPGPDSRDTLVDTLPIGSWAKGEAHEIWARFAPAASPQFCAVEGVWGVVHDKANLLIWREATTCRSGAYPDFEIKIDRSPH